MKKTGLVALVIALLAACAGVSDPPSTSAGVPEAESTTTDAEEPTTTEPEPATTIQEEQGATSLEAPLEVGRTTTVGGWRLRIVSVTADATDQVITENEFNDPPAEGEQFFVATLEATYVGDESSTFWVDMTLKAVGDSNVAYESFDASCGVIPDDIDNAGETFPGGTITGNVCWKIGSDDANSLVLIVEESFSLDGTRQFLALDPSATPVEDTTSTDTGTNSVTELVAIGDSATVGSWDVTVMSVTADGTDAVLAANPFNEPPGEGEQFFLAVLEATYIGDESSTFWVDMTLKALGASNVAYEAFEASCGVIPDDINEAGETFPGGTVTGNVCWKIGSAEAVSLVMIAEESFSLDETRVFFSLTE